MNDNKSNHNLKEVLAAGKYCSIDSTDYTRVVLALDGTTLYIACKGSDLISDLKTDLSIGMTQDFAWSGQMHGGFWQRSSYMNVSDILELCVYHDLQEVITTGHSLGI